MCLRFCFRSVGMIYDKGDHDSGGDDVYGALTVMSASLETASFSPDVHNEEMSPLVQTGPSLLLAYLLHDSFLHKLSIYTSL